MPEFAQQLKAQFREMGILRNLLHVLALLFILILPFSSPARILEGWGLFFGGIVPATAPLVFIVLMFDVMMCKILSDGADPARSRQLAIALTWDLVLGFSVLGLWLYSFKAVLF